MKYLRTCLAVAGLAALSLGLPTHQAARPARASAGLRDGGRGRAATALPVQFSADGGELMVARLAYESGNYLLNKARHADKAAARRLLTQAEQHYRACLAHEHTTPDAGGLFADARRNLDAARKLLGAAPEKKADAGPRVARSTPPPAAPAPKPAVKTEPRRAEAGAAGGLMVGPDGVIYRRAAAD
jgi:hypothetical protein